MEKVLFEWKHEDKLFMVTSGGCVFYETFDIEDRNYWIASHNVERSVSTLLNKLFEPGDQVES